MRGDAFAGNRRHRFAGFGDVQLEPVRESIAAIVLDRDHPAERPTMRAMRPEFLSRAAGYVRVAPYRGHER